LAVTTVYLTVTTATIATQSAKAMTPAASLYGSWFFIVA
jgi:hypothetical protein